MAWADTCKVSFETTVVAKQHLKKKQRSINSVLKEISEESGIPFSTLKRWWIEIKKAKRFENEPPDTTTENQTENDSNEPDRRATQKPIPLCKRCKERPLLIRKDTGKPYGPSSKYHGLCQSCRRKFQRYTKKNEATTEENGIHVFCPKCGHDHYVLKP